MTDPIAERTRKVGGMTIRSVSDVARRQRLLVNNIDESEQRGRFLYELTRARGAV